MSDTTEQETKIDDETKDVDQTAMSAEDEAKEDGKIWDDIDASESAAGDDKPDGDEPSGETKSAAKPDETDTPDPADKLWEGSSEGQRAAFDAAQKEIKDLEQKDRSQRGRVSTLQRQINGITRQLDDRAAMPVAKGGTKPGPDSVTYLDSKDWKDFTSEYPEISGPLGKVIAVMQTEITTSQKRLNAIGNDRQNQAIEEQKLILEEAHPDWLDTATDDAFGPWLDDQPRHIREAAVRNAKEIVDAAEAGDVVARFKAFRSEQSESSDSPGNSRESVTDLSKKRKRQLESSASARGKGAGAATGIPADGDEEAIWKAIDQQEARAARQA